MGVVAVTAEDVPVPPIGRRGRRMAAMMIAIALIFCSLAVLAHKADAAATPGNDNPALVSVYTPPVGRSLRAPMALEVGDVEGEDGTMDVRVPGTLLLRLRAAHAAGDLDLFEDVAHELALILVGG